MEQPSAPLGAEAAYFDHLRRGVFALQVCGTCRKTTFPPKDACPHCDAHRLDWQSQEGQGSIYSVTTVRATEKGVAPYNVSLIDLDVGVRIMATVPDTPVDAVRIGARVRARVEDASGSARLVFDIIDGN